MPWTLNGVDEFRQFAEDVDDIDVQRAINNAVEQTAEDFIDRLTARIGRSANGRRTYHSETSPFSPGTSNDSSDDPYHIRERNAWDITFDSGKAVVRPKPEVSDRVRFFERGTSRHGPTGDTPMHYFVNGVRVVVAHVDKNDEDDINIWMNELNGWEDRRQFLFTNGVPGEVPGVEAKHFFRRTAAEIIVNDYLENNLEDALEREVEEAMSL